jgi:hypothetical protein
MSVDAAITHFPRRAPFASPLELVGTPYVRGGVTPDDGLDCYSLMAYVRWHWYGRRTPLVGIPARPMTTAQACAWGIYRALGGRERLASAWTQLREASEGCAVALGRLRASRLHHCGVYVEGGVLHSFECIGVAWTPAERMPHLFARVEFYECVPA